VNGAESPGYQSVAGKPVASPRGGRVGYLATDAPGAQSLVVDGKAFSTPQGFFENGGPIFSESGTRYAFAVTVPGGAGSRLSTVFIDGSEVTDLEIQGRVRPGRWTTQNESPMLLLSNDGQHYVVSAFRRSNRSERGLYLNGERLGDPGFRTSFTRVAFSRDSKHLTWVSEESPAPGAKNEFALYLDGERLFRFDRESQLSQAFTSSPLTWEMNDEGVVQLLAVKAEGIVRYRVTPDPNLSLAAVVARAAEARVRAVADAAKAQQEADAKAAAAALQAKADAEAAALKRKADADAANAARVKARQDAVDAKAKARLEAIEAKKAQKTKQP
jgi:hypothetical protein